MIAKWLGIGCKGREAFGPQFAQVNVRLPSDRPEYRFDVMLDIEWRSRTGRLEKVESIVIHEILLVAEDVLRRSDIIDCQLARQNLAAEFSRRTPLRLEAATVVRVGNNVEVNAACVEDVLQLERLMRQYRFERLARDQAKARVEFLRDSILANPADAQLYLLATDEGHFSGIPRGDALAQLIADVSWWAPSSRWTVVARLVHDYLSKLSDGQAAELVKAFTAAAEATGDQNFAEAVRAEVSRDRPDHRTSAST